MIDPNLERRTLTEFRRKRIMTVGQLAALLSCSVPTVRKRLKSWSTFTSYNRNSSYYALPEVARFDELGLWKYQGVFFSRHGNFPRTVQHVVSTSEMGLEAAEIGRLLGLSARSFMCHLPGMPGLVREKQQGRFVYFSAEPDKGEGQKQLRTDVARRAADELPTDSEAIAILVDRMKHPDSSYEQTAQRLRRRGNAVALDAIQALLAYHGVEKKTPGTR